MIRIKPLEWLHMEVRGSGRLGNSKVSGTLYLTPKRGGGCPRSVKMAKMAPKKRSAGPRRPPSKVPSGGLPRPEWVDLVPAGRGRGRRGPDPAAGAQTPPMPPGKFRGGRLLSPGHAWMLRQMDTMASSRFCISSVTDRTQYANRPLMAEKQASMLDLVL